MSQGGGGGHGRERGGGEGSGKEEDGGELREDVSEMRRPGRRRKRPHLARSLLAMCSLATAAATAAHHAPVVMASPVEIVILAGRLNL